MRLFFLMIFDEKRTQKKKKENKNTKNLFEKSFMFFDEKDTNTVSETTKPLFELFNGDQCRKTETEQNSE